MKTQLRISGATFKEYCRIRDYVFGAVCVGHLAHRKADATENGEVPYLEVSEGTFGGTPEIYNFIVRPNEISTNENDVKSKQTEAFKGLASLIMDMGLESKT